MRDRKAKVIEKRGANEVEKISKANRRIKGKLERLDCDGITWDGEYTE